MKATTRKEWLSDLRHMQGEEHGEERILFMMNGMFNHEPRFESAEKAIRYFEGSLNPFKRGGMTNYHFKKQYIKEYGEDEHGHSRISLLLDEYRESPIETLRTRHPREAEILEATGLSKHSASSTKVEKRHKSLEELREEYNTDEKMKQAQERNQQSVQMYGTTGAVKRNQKQTSIHTDIELDIDTDKDIEVDEKAQEKAKEIRRKVEDVFADPQKVFDPKYGDMPFPATVKALKVHRQSQEETNASRFDKKNIDQTTQAIVEKVMQQRYEDPVAVVESIVQKVDKKIAEQKRKQDEEVKKILDEIMEKAFAPGTKEQWLAEAREEGVAGAIHSQEVTKAS